MTAVFLKEIRLLIRSPKAFYLLLATLFMVGGTLALQWLSLIQGADLVSRRATLGREFFTLVSTVQLCVMGLTSAMMSAAAMSVEREEGTLEMLLATGLPRARVLLGKWLAAVTYQLVVAGCLLPILTLVFQLGGVGSAELLHACSLTVMTVLVYAMLGLALSCKCRRTGTALMATFAGLLLLNLLLPLFLLLFTGGLLFPNSFSPGKASVGLSDFILFSPSPLLAWLHQIGFMQGLAGAAPRVANPLLNPVFHGHLIFQALLFVYALRLGLRHMRRLSESADTPYYTGQLTRTNTPQIAPTPWIFFRAWKIGDGQSPVYVKDLIYWLEGRTAALAVVMTLFAIVSLGLIIPAIELDPLEFIKYLGATVLTLLLLAIPLFAAPAISRERESRTLDLLCATPLTAAAIVRAKFFAALQVVATLALPLLAMPLAIRGIMFLLGIGEHDSLSAWGTIRFSRGFLVPSLLLLLPVAAFSAFFIALAIYCSSRQRRSLPALLQSYLAMVFLIFMPIPIHAALAFLQSELASAAFGLALPIVNPYEFFFQGRPQLPYAVPLDPSVGPLPTAIGMALHAAAVLALAALLLRAAARRLRHERRRAA